MVCFDTSSQFVLSAVPPDSWKLLIMARRVSGSASAYSFWKNAFNSASPDPAGGASSASDKSNVSHFDDGRADDDESASAEAAYKATVDEDAGD